MALMFASVEEEFKKNPELSKDGIATIREWLEKQPHLPKLSDLDIILFLHSCFYSMEKTKYTIDTYYTVRTHVPEFFSKKDPNHYSVEGALSVVNYLVLPDSTPKGERIYLMKMQINDPSKFIFNDALKTISLISDFELRKNGTAKGHRIVIDMDGVMFGHLARLGIMSIKKFLFYLQEAMPIRLTGLHFINVVPFMDKILALMKPFMKQELMDMLYLHTDGMNSFYKTIPQSVMPSDYGGNAGSRADLRNALVKDLKANSNFFVQDEKMIVTESLRPGKAKNAGDLFGVEGSFKKLDLD